MSTNESTGTTGDDQPPNDPLPSSQTRRKFLGVSVAASALLAGCLGGDDEETDDSSGEDPESEEIEGENGEEGEGDGESYDEPNSYPAYLTGGTELNYTDRTLNADGDLTHTDQYLYLEDIISVSDVAYTLYEDAVIMRSSEHFKRLPTDDHDGWESDLEVIAGPYIVDGEIYVQTDSDQMAVVDLDDGERLDLYSTPDNSTGLSEHRVVKDGKIYSMTYDSDWYFTEYDIAADEVNVSDGFSDTDSLRGIDFAGYADGIAYLYENPNAGQSGVVIRAYDMETDEWVYEETIDGMYIDRSVLHGDKLVAREIGDLAHDPSYLGVYDLSEPEFNWDVETDTQHGFERFAVNQDYVFAPYDTGIAAHDLVTGDEVWSEELLDLPDEGLTATDDYVVFTEGDELYVLDASTGDEVLHDQLSSPDSISRLTIYGNELYAVGAIDDELYVHRYDLS